MSLVARQYQNDAEEAVWTHLNTKNTNPCIVIPTAGGKSFVLGNIANRVVTEFNGRVMILAHVKELLQQNHKAVLEVNPELSMKTGIYSAGLHMRDWKDDIIVAGIQSVYRKAVEFEKRDMLLIDEIHLLAPKTEGMYMQFIKEAKIVNPNLRVVGLTATPYRMKEGLICKPENMMQEICYEISVKQLIKDGYISKLITKATAKPPDFSRVRTIGGDFDSSEVEVIMSNVVDDSCQEIVAYTKERKTTLIFCASIAHAGLVASKIKNITGKDVGEIYGDTYSNDRKSTLSKFKDGSLPYLVNVGVLTTGLDVPRIDCIVLLRPTKSPGLYYQMVGRGFRIYPNLDDCLILDYGGNIMRHGPVDCIEITEREKVTGDAPAKTCPKCQTVVNISVMICPDCCYEFPEVEKDPHDAKASNAAIISGEIQDTVVKVIDVRYKTHKKAGYDIGDPITVRVDYVLETGLIESEWLCPEHQNFARRKFIKFWAEACVDNEAKAPRIALHVVEAFEIGVMRIPDTITVRVISGNKYSQIVKRDYSGGAVKARAEEIKEITFEDMEGEKEITLADDDFWTEKVNPVDPFEGESIPW